MTQECGKREVSFVDFLKELQRKVKSHQENGTSWNKEISRLAFLIATEANCISFFMDKEISKKTIIDLLPNLSDEEVEDVSKKLYKIAKRLYLDTTLPDEIKEVYKKINNKHYSL